MREGSLEQVATKLPSAEKAAKRTEPEWPWEIPRAAQSVARLSQGTASVRRQSPVWVSQIFARPWKAVAVTRT